VISIVVLRKTRQSQAIREVFSGAARPLSAREAVSLAQEAVPSLGIATVYRAIKELAATAWLVPVSTPAGTCFERARKEHHHHFFCRACLRSFDIEACVGALARLTPAGFVAEDHELTVIGRCRACAGRGDEPIEEKGRTAGHSGRRLASARGKAELHDRG
jgi:Fur family ferric uptake transcriptional regulator